MRRILIGLIALAIIAGGGWFGFNAYVQHRAAAEVDAAFEQLRAGGGKASHGKVAFDLATRTLTIDDIAVERGAQTSVKIAGIKATGVRQIDDTRVSADSIELSDTQFAYEGAAGATNLKAAYKAPQIILHDFSGPMRTQGAPASDSLIDVYRFVLEQFMGVTASSVVAPTIIIAVNPGSSGPGSGDITYSGLAIEKINRGKFDAAKMDRAAFSFNVQQPGRPDKLTGELTNVIVNEFDATAVAAVLDPQKANDDSFHRVYRQVSTGTYVVTSAQGVRAQIDGFSIDDIALQPSRFRLAEILALLPKDQSTPPTPAQSREMLEKLAGLYEGLRVGKAAIGTTSISTPQGVGKLRAIRYGQGEIALEGLDAPSPQGQVRMERFALKSFNTANLMRWAAQFANPAQKPTPDAVLGVFRVLEGAEIKGVVSPFKTTNKTVNIDTLSLSWGQLVGSIPSKASFVAKMVVPTDPANPALTPLIAAGIDKLALNVDLGAAWTESSSAFVLAPATIDLGNILKAQVRIALGNVPREVFSADPAQAMQQATQIEAGAIELSLRDNGGVDLAVAQFARIQNVSRDAARRAIIEIIKTNGEGIAGSNPDVAAAVEAIARFVETSGQTLVIKLTPLGKVPVMQLLDALNAEPMVALAQFRIEASTGL
ncbi:hypothetical protein [Bradyrhizobium liaoningense]|uniref:hypothetical protein n=1 Tax=Bradyrhizobium liaoningense TaxID=43992 RepID=UPI001BA61181|nr:hypothetical protein [Bradyrhizobium liaoningense]MBR0713800.1 hypothetical protein [Bradyrhizobium liaoningense]